MTTDLLTPVAAAAARSAAARAELEHAIRAAQASGQTLRAVAADAGLSYETVRRIVGAAEPVAVEPEPEPEPAALVEVRVPGFVYYECFDPLCTDVPRESGWPVPHTVKMGKGYQMRYTVSREMALDMIETSQSWGESMSYGVDDPRAGRTVYRWALRERERLAEQLAEVTA